MNSNSNLAVILRDVTLGGRLVPREALAETGVDIEILERVFELWRQHRDYLRGYRNFDDIIEKPAAALDDVDAFDASGLRGKHRNALVLVEGGIAQERDFPAAGNRMLSSYLTIPDGYKTNREREIRRDTRIGKFLIAVTRDCKWIIFTNFPVRSSFLTADSPREAVRKALDALSADTYFTQSGGSLVYQSLALALADNLRSSLMDSIHQKEEDVKREKPTLEAIKTLMNKVRYY